MGLIPRKTHFQTPKQGYLFLFFFIKFTLFASVFKELLCFLLFLVCPVSERKTEERQFAICFAAYKPLARPTTVMMKCPSHTQSEACELEMTILGEAGCPEQ